MRFCILSPKELCECTYAVGMVGRTARLSAAVHGKDGIAHVHAAQGQGGSQNVSKRAAACYVAMVHKTLARNACLAANLGKD